MIEGDWGPRGTDPQVGGGKWGDLLARACSGRTLGAGEIQQVRMIGNALQGLIALASRVNPSSGDITELRAGNVRLANDGLYAGDDNVVITERGIEMLCGLGESNWVKWLHESGGNIAAYMLVYDLGTGTIMEIINDPEAGQSSHILMRATDGTDYADLSFVCMNDNTASWTITTTGIENISGSKTELVVNEESADRNFRVESNGNANMVFIDGGNDKVGIGDAAPGEVLDVAGNINATGVVKIDDVQVVSNRVVDARCDDAVNSGDATTDGVIDALRDAMITHGLIAAA